MIGRGGKQEEREARGEGLKGGEAVMGDNQVVIREFFPEFRYRPQVKDSGGFRAFRGGRAFPSRGGGGDYAYLEVPGTFLRGEDGSGRQGSQVPGVFRAEADQDPERAGRGVSFSPPGQGEEAGVEVVGRNSAGKSREEVYEKVETGPARAAFIYAYHRGQGRPEPELPGGCTETVQDDPVPGSFAQGAGAGNDPVPAEIPSPGPPNSGFPGDVEKGFPARPAEGLGEDHGADEMPPASAFFQGGGYK
jgi:hypothetical protein